MKKLLFLLLVSFLVLGACGNKEENKSEDKKETKALSKDGKKKDEKKKSNDDKKEESDKEDFSNTVNTQQDESQQANTEQQTQFAEQPQSTQETVQSQEQMNNQEQQTNSNDGLHYDPAYDKPGYTGMVNESGMPELDPNENFDPHGGAVPGEGYMDTEEAPREDAASGPRSLREIKEDTGKGASDFTQSEIDEANAYAREH